MMWKQGGHLVRRGAAQSQVFKVAVRTFAYEDTFAFRVHGPKPLALVIHPVLPSEIRKPIPEVLWDAEEALGLARANRWDLLPGPNEPRGGWDHETLAQVEEQELRRRAASGAWNVPEGFHRDRGEEEDDDEFDVNEVAWKNGIVKRQWAETCILRVRQIEPRTFFGEGKIKELALHVANNPPDVVFVNTNLTPSQNMQLETVFRNGVAAGIAKKRRAEGRAPRFGLPEIEVYDRTRLVLDIFQNRASTPQAKVQVGLAKLEFMKTRLTMGTDAKLKETFQMLQEFVGPYHSIAQRTLDGAITQYHYEDRCGRYT
eukprot:TRINITY_DN16721_c0_g1_i1.p1 TRINITY_DN16721_c0_g1~~TRINITY_DN16721_c0_g1_i1.p1  ORF type:complete len:315 (-),score=59.77 TRINITY_DN16721_c0_g1_i1:74-1018(-)